jgi:ATP-binding protein involved in chromosome partitioning
MADGHQHGDIPFTGATSTRVLGITSGKGGVGKSSVTVNLAVALAQLGHRVAIIDADVYGFSVPDMLGVTEEPELTEHQQIVPPVAHGVKVVSIGFFVEADTPVMWRGPMLHKALEQFLTDVIWGDVDYLLIDMPPGTGDVAMSMSKLLSNAEVFVVTTPQPAAQTVAQRSGAMAREMGLAVAGVIENMSWFTGDDGTRYELFGAGGGEALAQKLNTHLLATIPLVPSLREGGDTGQPVVVAEPASEAAVVFQQLAKTIEQSTPKRVYRNELRVH